MDKERATYLSIFELDQPRFVNHYLVSLVFARLKQLWQRKPLSRHLISVVCINKLIVVNAVGRVALYTLDGGFAVVEGDDVVDEGLASGGEPKGF